MRKELISIEARLRDIFILLGQLYQLLEKVAENGQKASKNGNDNLLL